MAMTDEDRLSLSLSRIERAADRLKRMDETEMRLALMEERMFRLHAWGLLVALVIVLCAVAAARVW